MATMKDVARLAGVSTSTVSHVINKDRFVSEAITAKVEAAIKELNYAPSALARSLKLNQTHTIGMLITASTNPFYSELVRGVERSCFERGYSLVLCNTEGDEQRMNRNLETLMQKRVDGLLLLCTETHQPSREIMQRYPTVPTVMMDWAPFDGDSDLIQDNSLLGGDLATQYLIDKGHTRIACITGPLDKTPARLRLEGYRAAAPAWRLLVLIRDGEVLRQHEGGFFGADIFQTGNKVNHIPVCLTAETVEAPVNLHAGVFIVMEGADAHPGSSHPDAVMLGSLPGGNRLLHDFKYVQ